MKKDFYIFRHGLTDMNVIGRWQGSGVDFPLNDEGVRQAYDLAATLKTSGIEIIFSSPLKRAVQTANIVAEKLNIPVQTDSGLIEGCFGLAEGKTKPEIDALFQKTASEWHSLEEEFLDVRFEGGESKREIQQRFLKTLKEIGQGIDSSVIGISAHSAVIRCFMLLFGLKLYAVPHGYPFHLRFYGEVFEFIE